MAGPKISVLIPTYNYGRYLGEAVESVLAQDFTDYELLICDDCSTDDTAVVAARYCALDSRVVFLRREANLGMVNNWNDCLRRARGTYVKYLFGDDRFCHPQALGTLLGLLEANPAAALATSARAILDGRSQVRDVYGDLAPGFHEGRKIITATLLANGRNLVGEPSAVLFRKADAGRGFNPRYTQVVDVEMWFHLLGKGGLACTPAPLCGFRVHSEQMTERNTASGAAMREHAEFFTECALAPEQPRAVVFPLLRHLRRLQKHQPNEVYAKCAERLIAKAGPGWRRDLQLYTLWLNLTAPGRNLRRAIRKRHFRRTFRPLPPFSY